MYKKIDAHDLTYFRSFLSEEQVLCGDGIADYAHDMTEDFFFPPEIVLKPKSTEEVSRIMQYAHQQRICVTPIGARTGLSGGMLCVCGGIGLSMEKMNQILTIDTENFYAIVQAGVITETLQKAVEEKGLYYPPDPSSKGSCFIGGNIAESAGGLHAVKYGTTKDFVLNLQVVLPNGAIIHTGASTLKFATGYHLTQLFVGSEGTLGVITEATLKLIPLPKHRLLMQVNFASAFEACHAVARIFHLGITPAALEFMERDAILFGLQYLGLPNPYPEHLQAQLLIELDGNYMDTLFQEMEIIYEMLQQNYSLIDEPLLADTAEKQDSIWKLRKCLGHAVKRTTIYKEEDTVVPRAHLPHLLQFVKQVGKEYGFRSVCYGHAGDGNLHINIIKENLDDYRWKEILPKEAIPKIFQFTKQLYGTLSGEHGIGWVQKSYMPIVYSSTHLHLMKELKKVFDPNLILNPNKILPDELPAS